MNYKHNDNILQIGTRNKNTHGTNGIKNIYENGTYDLFDYSRVHVEVDDYTQLREYLAGNLQTYIDLETTVIGTQNGSTYAKQYFNTQTSLSMILMTKVTTFFQKNYFVSLSNLDILFLPSIQQASSSMISSCNKYTKFIQAKYPCKYGYRVFNGAQNLKKIIMNPTQNSDTRFLYSCPALTTLVLLNQDFVFGQDSTSSIITESSSPLVKQQGYVYVPQNLIEDYKSCTAWENCQFRAIEDYPTICDVPDLYMMDWLNMDRVQSIKVISNNLDQL